MLKNRFSNLFVLDFDGTLVDSFVIIEKTFDHFDYRIGTLENFRNRGKFLKYLGGRKEFIPNFVRKLRGGDDNLRDVLTQLYRDEAQLFNGIKDFLSEIQQRGDIAISIISRNVTIEPYNTIQTVLRNNGIFLRDIDSIYTVPVGDKKHKAMKFAMESYTVDKTKTLSIGDEIGDYKSATKCGIEHIACAYGYDSKKRLRKSGITEESIIELPEFLGGRALHFLNGV